MKNDSKEEKKRKGLSKGVKIALIAGATLLIILMISTAAGGAFYYKQNQNRAHFRAETYDRLSYVKGALSDLERSSERVFTTEEDSFERLNEVNFAIAISSEKKYAKKLRDEIESQIREHEKMSDAGVSDEYKRASKVYNNSLIIVDQYIEDLEQIEKLTQTSIQIDELTKSVKTDTAIRASDTDKKYEKVLSVTNQLKIMEKDLSTLKVDGRNEERKEAVLDLLLFSIEHFEFYYSTYQERIELAKLSTRDKEIIAKISASNREIQERNENFTVKVDEFQLSYLESNKASLTFIKRDCDNVRVEIEKLQSKLN